MVYSRKGEEFETGVGKMALIQLLREMAIGKSAKSASTELLKQHGNSTADLNYIRY